MVLYDCLYAEEVKIKQKLFVHILSAVVVLNLCGCGKVALKDPVYLPGLGDGPVRVSEQIMTMPIFENGTVVRHKLMDEKFGIVMHNRYRYFPNLTAWYCIVDFYPSSAIHLDFSDFDNYERRYVYEFELEEREQFTTAAMQCEQISARWKSFTLNIVE